MVKVKQGLKYVGSKLAQPFKDSSSKERNQAEELGGKILRTMTWSDKLFEIGQINGLIEGGYIIEAAHRTLALARVWLRAASRREYLRQIDAFGRLRAVYEEDMLISFCHGDRELLRRVIAGEYLGVATNGSKNIPEDQLSERDVGYVLREANYMKEDIEFMLGLVLDEDVQPRPIWFHQGIAIPPPAPINLGVRLDNEPRQ